MKPWVYISTTPIMFFIIMGLDYLFGWERWSNIPDIIVGIAGIYTIAYLSMMVYIYLPVLFGQKKKIEEKDGEESDV